ncbi:MAG TPA: helix-turn-helix transcriptional regulator [Eoetvoesiella sp.]|uniref:helix-turn-helix domain-containing protein n=1 Tax=Eoetvoesiella sp. TaxID=1966355 RepID=UPI002B589035|nr:helix-turn-helix transcriptional regulator [Eoetvoesiella sp.]HWK61799.1 helix-turn-helix transcriptional regulator [Eoetvoesiella sp.]
MSQPLTKETEDVAATSATQSLGATLRALRRAKQLSVAEVSARLKYSVRQLEALEAEQWELLPTGVPLRGLVKNYGRLLEADVDALIVMLEREVGIPGVQPIVLPSAAMSSSDMAMQSDMGQRSSWGWLVVIVVLLIVAGFYAIERGWVPDSWLIFDWLKSLKQ